MKNLIINHFIHLLFIYVYVYLFFYSFIYYIVLPQSAMFERFFAPFYTSLFYLFMLLIFSNPGFSPGCDQNSSEDHSLESSDSYICGFLHYLHFKMRFPLFLRCFCAIYISSCVVFLIVHKSSVKHSVFIFHLIIAFSLDFAI